MACDRDVPAVEAMLLLRVMGCPGCCCCRGRAMSWPLLLPWPMPALVTVAPAAVTNATTVAVAVVVDAAAAVAATVADAVLC